MIMHGVYGGLCSLFGQTYMMKIVPMHISSICFSLVIVVLNLSMTLWPTITGAIMGKIANDENVTNCVWLFFGLLALGCFCCSWLTILELREQKQKKLEEALLADEKKSQGLMTERTKSQGPMTQRTKSVA